jgi:hypothetical protein
MARKMIVTLKNLKVAEFASEETTCFSATVYLDGKRAMTVKNDGHGGSHFMEPLNGDRDKFRAAQRQLDAAAAAAPLVDLGFGDGGADFQPDADWLISMALEEALHLKDMKRILKKVVGIKAGETGMRTWNVKADAHGIARVKHHFPGVRILNEMSETDALTLWKKEMG